MRNILKYIVIFGVAIIVAYFWGFHNGIEKNIETTPITKKMTVDEFLSKTPTPTNDLPVITITPTQAPVQPTEDTFPSWCPQVVDAWMQSGFNRAQANQMMKKDNIECTY